MQSLFGFLAEAHANDLEAMALHAAGAANRNAAGQTEPGATPSLQSESAGVAGPSVFRSGPLLAAVRGTPRWSADLDNDLGAESNAAAVMSAYRQLGVDFLSRLMGSFALVIIDTQNRTVSLAIDRFGIERLAYASGPYGLVFGTSATDVANAPLVKASLRNQAFFDYVFAHMLSAPDTVYERVFKLPPATWLTYEEGHVRVRRYWQPEFNETKGADLPRLQSDLLAALEKSVQDTKPTAECGAFLSGGLDSSTITGMLTRSMGPPVKTYSIGFGLADFDELRYARITNRHFGCQAHEYNATPADVTEAFPRVAAAYDEPFGNPSAVPTLLCARLAAENGTTHLLAGDGGDELFAGNQRYAEQRVFEAYYHIPALVRRLLLEPLPAMVDPESRIAPLRKLRNYTHDAQIPLPDRLERWNLTYRTDPQTIFDADFLSSVDRDSALERMRAIFRSAPCQSSLNRLLYYDWHVTLADNDLRKVNVMCELAGVRVSYPMLHEAVVDVSLRVPPGEKLNGLKLRSFYKRAMRGFLPAETLGKSKHGFGLPFGEWLKTDTRMAELFYSLLSGLKGRNIIAARFIDDLIEQQRAGHPSYFGYVMWDLAMLEQWLEVHGA